MYLIAVRQDWKPAQKITPFLPRGHLIGVARKATNKLRAKESSND
jgi:hypothetical protein